jgi:hypothetical membrane protein
LSYPQRSLATRISLRAGLAVPFAYYGVQCVAALFYPGYSFVRDMASVLGSRSAPHPAIWNTGMLLVGLATLGSALGYSRGFRRLSVRPVVAGLAVTAVISNGLLSLASGLFPLEDPRHNGGPLVIGALLLPWLFAAAIWSAKGARALRFYFLSSGAMLLVMAPIMGQAVAIGLGSIHGALQRFLTLSMFPPLAVMAWYLLRTRAESDPPGRPASS